MSLSHLDHSAAAAISSAVARPVADLVAIPAVLMISGEVGAS
ncbi:hypothetical protein [Geothrix alkalitolerans]|nr:hypothetical protein [Geothrix alkalitolerans]